MKTGVVAGPEGFIGTEDIAEGSIDSFMPAGDFRELFAEDFTEIPAAVIGIRDGGTRDEVKVDGEWGRLWNRINWVAFRVTPEDFVLCD